MLGALILTTGVTTLAAQHPDTERLNVLWSGKESPGPRVIGGDELSADAVSGIADAMTPGLDTLLQSRQARLIAATKGAWARSGSDRRRVVR